MSGEHVLGLLLAGGQARRMGGGDKCLKELAGKSLLQHAIDRLQPQVSELLINANGNPDRFRNYEFPVVPDVVPGFAGPLAGILTGLTWAKEHAPQCSWVISVPTDAPFFPRNIVSRLITAALDSNSVVAVAQSDGRTHPVFALWSTTLVDDLRDALVNQDMRKIDRFTEPYPSTIVEWSIDPYDPFLNINRPEDLVQAEALGFGSD